MLKRKRPSYVEKTIRKKYKISLDSMLYAALKEATAYSNVTLSKTIESILKMYVRF